MFHLLSNTSNSYLSRFNEARVSLNSSEKCSGTLKMRKADIPGLFCLLLALSTSSIAIGGGGVLCWRGCGFPAAAAHTLWWDISWPQMALENKIGIAGVITFWAYSNKYIISQEVPFIRAHYLT